MPFNIKQMADLLNLIKHNSDCGYLMEKYGLTYAEVGGMLSDAGELGFYKTGKKTLLLTAKGEQFLRDHENYLGWSRYTLYAMVKISRGFPLCKFIVAATKETDEQIKHTTYTFKAGKCIGRIKIITQK